MKRRSTYSQRPWINRGIMMTGERKIGSSFNMQQQPRFNIPPIFNCLLLLSTTLLSRASQSSFFRRTSFHFGAQYLDYVRSCQERVLFYLVCLLKLEGKARDSLLDVWDGTKPFLPVVWNAWPRRSNEFHYYSSLCDTGVAWGFYNFITRLVSCSRV